MAISYACPYCGEEIKKDEILFWVETKESYTDNRRGDFLSRHNVQVPAGNKFNRKYFRPHSDEDYSNISRVDSHDYPVEITDSMANSLTPEELENNARHDTDFGSNDDEAFDSDGLPMEKTTEEEDEAEPIPDRACPHCHCSLHADFGILETYHVAMFGGRAAGKTSYLVNLFQQLPRQLSNNNLGSVELIGESGELIQGMITDYENEGTTKPTPKDTRLLPILCRYNNQGKQAFIVFYDFAGEGAESLAYVAKHPGIKRCETVMLVIDPNMINGDGSYYQQWQVNQANRLMQMPGGKAQDYCETPLDTFFGNAGTNCRRYAENAKNIICVITKLDMLLSAEAKKFNSKQIELLSDVGTKHMKYIDQKVIQQEQSELSNFLKTKNIDIKDKIHNAFGEDKAVYVLGVSTSTLTSHPEKGEPICFEAKSEKTASKHRIIEPFLVTAMTLGLIGVKTMDGTIRWKKKESAAQAQESETAGGQQAEKKKEKKKGFFARLFGGGK